MAERKSSTHELALTYLRTIAPKIWSEMNATEQRIAKVRGMLPARTMQTEQQKFLEYAWACEMPPTQDELAALGRQFTDLLTIALLECARQDGGAK